MTRAVRFVWISFFVFILFFAVLIIGTSYGLLGKIPSIEELENPSALMASEVYADDGTPMGKFYLENRSPVDYKDISKNVINALVATEDQRFYEHNGIDGEAMLRVVKGILTFNLQGGGSTISQQLALALFGGDRATNKMKRATQKIKEWVIAVKLERNFTKEEIINYYLNKVAFSENVFGIRNASLTFFQKQPDRLSVEEAAVLVGMVNAPTRYNPRRNPKAALDRRNLVISRMATNKFISEEVAASLKRKPIELNFKKIDQSQGIAPYFRESTVKEEVKRMLKDLTKANGEKYDIYKDGLRIYTSINPTMQEYAEEAMAKTMAANQRIFNGYEFVKTGSVFNKRQKEVEKFVKQSDRWRYQKSDGMSDEENRRTFTVKTPMKIFTWNAKREKDTIMTPLDSIKYLKTHLQSGFIAMEPQTGFIKAWVGGIDFKTFKIDHSNLSIKRQVGSSIKPMLYCEAIEEAGFTPETPLDNVPQYFPGNGWVPANNKGASGGSPPMAVCIARSLNGAAAYLMKQIGAPRFVEFLNRCKVQTKLTPYPSLALGSCDLSLYEMIWMYTMFPGRGFNIKPQIVTRIEDRNGNVLVAVGPQISEVISEVTAYTMSKMMGGAIKFGTATRMRNYNIKAEMGCKTGTTNSNTDAWFMVFTPELLCGSWVGCDENWIHFPSSSAAGYGGAAALPTCGTFLEKVYNDKKLAYNPEAKFIKPAVEKNDIIYDYFENISGPPSPEAEGTDMGNGNRSDYEYYNEPEPLLKDSASGMKQIEKIDREKDNGGGGGGLIGPTMDDDDEPAVEKTKTPAAGNKTDTTKKKPVQKPKAVLPPSSLKPSDKKPEKDY
jgi:penicillin-binding protein 1A